MTLIYLKWETVIRLFSRKSPDSFRNLLNHMSVYVYIETYLWFFIPNTCGIYLISVFRVAPSQSFNKYNYVQAQYYYVLTRLQQSILFMQMLCFGVDNVLIFILDINQVVKRKVESNMLVCTVLRFLLPWVRAMNIKWSVGNYSLTHQKFNWKRFLFSMRKNYFVYFVHKLKTWNDLMLSLSYFKERLKIRNLSETFLEIRKPLYIGNGFRNIKNLEKAFLLPFPPELKLMQNANTVQIIEKTFPWISDVIIKRCFFSCRTLDQKLLQRTEF